jgi:hypothetical protein
MLGVPIERDPGRHVVQWLGDRSGRENERVVDLGVGDRERIVLPLDAPEAGVAAEPPRTPAPTGGRRGLRVAGWAALGLGSASLIGAGAALIAFEHDRAELPGCAPKCPQSDKPSVQPTVDNGHTAATLVNVLGAVGLAGVVIGATFLSIGSPSSASPAASAGTPVASRGVLLVLSPGGLEAEGRF